MKTQLEIFRTGLSYLYSIMTMWNNVNACKWVAAFTTGHIFATYVMVLQFTTTQLQADVFLFIQFYDSSSVIHLQKTDFSIITEPKKSKTEYGLQALENLFLFAALKNLRSICLFGHCTKSYILGLAMKKRSRFCQIFTASIFCYYK